MPATGRRTAVNHEGRRSAGLPSERRRSRHGFTASESESAGVVPRSPAVARAGVTAVTVLAVVAFAGAAVATGAAPDSARQAAIPLPMRVLAWAAQRRFCASRVPPR